MGVYNVVGLFHPVSEARYFSAFSFSPVGGTVSIPFPGFPFPAVSTHVTVKMRFVFCSPVGTGSSSARFAAIHGISPINPFPGIAVRCF